MFNTPILFIIFNRFDTTKQVFSVIRKVKPSHLFVAADGPRQTIEGEFDYIKNKYITPILIMANSP
ncbi:MAG: hypothetical protein LBG48_02420 [Rickettsiales bacterium]|jgi:LPS sulfotransferase NodH|nr:hypothetical protein [Rickettsiales bacterium]